MLKSAVKFVVALLVILLRSCHPALASAPGTWTLDDFEDGDLKAASGLYWFALADDLAGGASEARLEIHPGDATSSPHVLGLTGRLAGHGAFAGAWVDLDRSGRAVDLGAFEGVRLRVRGPSRLQVGFRSGMINFMAEVDASPVWRSVDIPFASLAPQGKAPEGTRWSTDAVHVFGVTTPQIPRDAEGVTGDVALEVDDVVLYGRGKGNPAPVATGPAGSVAIVPFTPMASIPSAGWVHLADDPAHDGKLPSLPDATSLEMIPASGDGIIWLRMILSEAPNDRWLGLNAALDVDGDPENGQAWWGANSGFKFDRLVTVWCIRVAEGCQGYIGIASADQVAAGTMASGGAPGVRFAIDHEKRAFVVGIPRAALGLGVADPRLVAAVGSALLYNDDVPGQGAATLR
jgi:hypothetical protein